MNTSIVQQRGNVSFPEYTGERVYMHEFTKQEGLPENLKRWQPTVDAMLDGVDTEESVFLMVDQSEVMPGKSHRRGGVHIDGVWDARLYAHGTPSHGMPNRGHRTPGGHVHNMSSYWKEPWKFGYDNQGIILAADVTGCIAYSGEWEGEPQEGGDCSHIDLSSLTALECTAGKVFAGNVWMLHESVPIQSKYRTLVRLNVNGWQPQ